MKDLAYYNYLKEFLTESRIEKIDSVLSKRTQHFTVCIEDVFQLHNTSAVMRTCDVFGIQSLHVINQRFEKNIDTEIAMGAQKWVDVFKYNQTQEAIDSLKKKGYRIIATSPNKQHKTITEFSIDEKAAFFFGTERNGLTDSVLQQADELIHIPMVGFTESLNISVAAAIILQELTQKLRNSTIEWQLSEDAFFDKRIQWFENSIKHIDSIKKAYLKQLG
uniref:TrmH family RNA methyltransferase n=1 Tax=Flavobacterium sp. TaxID=239 RepID=UPI00404A3DB6